MMADKLKINFLHIGKTAGTQIKYISNQVNKKSSNTKIIKHAHQVILSDLPRDEEYFFSIREPIARFKSGFYSRKRKGRPRNNCEWNAGEKIAFSTFEHANDLAEKIYDEDELGKLARGAINSITHCAKKQVEWFFGVNDFLNERKPIWIISQESFSSDIEKLLSLIGFEDRVMITKDPVESHMNNYLNTPDLSPVSIENLKKWYQEDFLLYESCLEWKEKNM
jgi:hypothetical protein